MKREPIDALIDALGVAVKSSTARLKWERIASRIANAKSKRDAISHHFLTYNPRRPDQLWSTNFARPGSRSEPLDEDKLMELGRTLGEINFDLIFTKKPARRTANYMSRSFRRMMAGR
jgi:hypothetical protein